MTMILFCSQPFRPREVDADFAEEHTAAKDAGFSTALIDHTKASEGDASGAVRHVPTQPVTAVYRGWMMRVQHYAAFHAALTARGVSLVNDPDAYRFCHHLPESYSALEGDTPRTTWLPVQGPVEFSQVFERLQLFGSGPVIVKDFVKSQKHDWNEACFIPNAEDRPAVERVVRRFMELQGEDLNEGLVFREYVPLRIVGRHPRSAMPLAAEVRTFWFDGELLLAHPYWGDLATPPAPPPSDWMHHVASRVRSRFFTMDVALREDGRWTVIELGDGQVAGLPALGLAKQLYEQLRGALGGRVSAPRA
ncbi:ATP-grasp domain-containing protein [Polyangium mundeleinium]|uniref:ATP-grasp domain-containing protein n=1 Tax=Polyangium mundeleinium TaxID=2995306 RepID=A0ABT5F825_9BACT|nr:ATP-grasp domain-containing protein [Polyangium mundeleinium]MDC0749307.1 ATP-grasp domain-containing protein [Polyangium mundeleinium]